MSKIFTFDEGYAPGTYGAVWIEENMSLWPLFKMRHQGGVQKDAEIETHTVELFSVDAGGNKVEAKLTLRGSAGVGLPRYWDQDALFAVEELLQEKGGPDKDGGLDFSLRQLAQVAGYVDAGEYYERMRASLDRIGSTWIISDKAFYNPRTQSLISDRFNLWTVKFRDDRDLYSRHLREQHRLQFHRNFIDSYEGGYGRYLDRDFYWSLRYPTSKRLYRLLSSQFAYQSEWQVDPFTLRDLMLIGGYRHVSRILQAMNRAHEELRSKGFLRSVEMRKLSDGKKVLLYRSSKKYATHMREQRVLDDPETRVAYELLKEHKVWRSTRLSLIETHGAKRCIEACEALVRKRGVRDEGAWLLSAIQEGYEFPEDDEPEVPAVQPGSGEEAAPNKGRKGKALDDDTDEGTQNNERSDEVDRDGRGRERPKPERDPEAAGVWMSVLERVSEEKDTPSFIVWFEGTIPVSVGPDSLTISVPNKFAEDYIQKRFQDELQQALAGVIGIEDAHLVVESHGAENS